MDWDPRNVTDVEQMEGDHPEFITLAKSVPAFKELLPFDSMIAIADNEKFLYVNQGETVNSFRYRGDPIPRESGLHQCQVTGTKIILSLPKEVYGAPAKTRSVPVRDARGKIIGAISLGVLGYAYESNTIVAESVAMRQVLHLAYKLAQVDSTIMLTGESGTGKEVVADYIHRHSKRCRGAFIAVNCAALPEPLIESELFGYKRGAFTGANFDRVGLFEAATGGTLFLDEIAELPLAIQSKLLRVLETNKVRRVGSTEDKPVDFRLMVATHGELKEMVKEKRFREDLYYRLNVVPIRLPPLRERPEDIVLLARKFHDDYCRKYDVHLELDMRTISEFLQYDWPGNVRELRNAIERRVITGAKDSPDALVRNEVSCQAFFKLLGLEGNINEVLSRLEKLYIESILESCGGNVSRAARQMGITRMGLYKKIKRLNAKQTISAPYCGKHEKAEKISPVKLRQRKPAAAAEDHILQGRSRKLE